ncbi:hypothetical protein VVT58_13375 [Sphingobium sp. SJ10-10]|uniref:hypothetical protein n=1 Tax=Sphingobium sp. SJ10-10 TaxID=3114999 RepID=UPI002E19B69A|nr:hypothetical protein [Sphingobium sp. SJ10-10]
MPPSKEARRTDYDFRYWSTIPGRGEFVRLIAGLRYAFPLRMATLMPSFPRLADLDERVAALPELQDYLGSDRRLPFTNEDVFRHYPELDAA